MDRRCGCYLAYMWKALNVRVWSRELAQSIVRQGHGNPSSCWPSPLVVTPTLTDPRPPQVRDKDKDSPAVMTHGVGP